MTEAPPNVGNLDMDSLYGMLEKGESLLDTPYGPSPTSKKEKAKKKKIRKMKKESKRKNRKK